MSRKKKPNLAKEVRPDGFGKLSDKQIRAGQLLNAGLSQVAIAKEIDVSTRSLTRWLNTSELFKKYLGHLRKERADQIQRIIEANRETMAANMQLAIATCFEIMGSGTPIKDDYQNTVIDSQTGQPLISYRYSTHERLRAAALVFSSAIKMLPNTEPPDTIEAEVKDADFSEERLKEVRENVYGIY